jgi:putative SOS response-associated peptidase YedK
MDALRRIDEKAARIHARQMQIETRAQQAAWLRVVAVLTRARYRHIYSDLCVYKCMCI